MCDTEFSVQKIPPVKSNHIALYAKKYSDFSNYVHTQVTKLLFFEHSAELSKVKVKNT